MVIEGWVAITDVLVLFTRLAVIVAVEFVPDEVVSIDGVARLFFPLLISVHGVNVLVVLPNSAVDLNPLLLWLFPYGLSFIMGISIVQGSVGVVGIVLLPMPVQNILCGFGHLAALSMLGIVQ